MRQPISFSIVVLSAMITIGCSSSRHAFNPKQQFTVADLRSDYQLFRHILEESHPSLYWFTPKDSMDLYFDQGFARLNDSMDEVQFRNILSQVTSRIHCGHTTVKFSKRYSHYLDTLRQPVFPLSLKVWPDSMAVVANLNRKDLVLRRGTVITAINGRSTRQITDTLFSFLAGDGHILNGKYQTLSNRGTFGNIYRNVFGLSDHFTVNYIDTDRQEKQAVVPIFEPPPDTSRSRQAPSATRPRKPEKEEPRTVVLRGSRNVQIDTTLHSAYMTVNTFSRGQSLKSFFRRTFRVLKKNNIRHLVVDVRGNGGGDASNSTLLTRYLADKKFKLADSLYAVRRSSHYGKHIEMQPLYWLLTQFVTRKKSDGYYHLGYFERHYFKPKKRFHFDGDVYILIGGNSFSATTLFVKVLQGQPNVKVIGEETGGGAYGNTAWMIPDVTLPRTRLRFRLPKFRLVMDSSLVREGRGVMPDIMVPPSAESIRRGIDPKVDTVRKMILQKNGMVKQ